MRHNLTRSPTAHRHPTQHPAPPPRQPWSVLVLLGIAQFMVILDGTVVSIALPSISRALHLATADLQWVATAYVLLTGGLVLLDGRASDLLPRLLLLGLGAGLVVPAASVTAMRVIAAGQAGLASGPMVTTHEVGAALGVAVLSAVAAAADQTTTAGFAVGFRHGFAVAAAVAAALAVAALLAVPPVRPAPGVKAAVH
jgi:MFS family permease